jgi:hypothetical protein
MNSNTTARVGTSRLSRLSRNETDNQGDNKITTMENKPKTIMVNVKAVTI